MKDGLAEMCKAFVKLFEDEKGDMSLKLPVYYQDGVARLPAMVVSLWSNEPRAAAEGMTLERQWEVTTVDDTDVRGTLRLAPMKNGDGILIGMKLLDDNEYVVFSRFCQQARNIQLVDSVIIK